MNAFQPSRPPIQPVEQRRIVPRPKRHLRQRAYQVMALETTAKVIVNIVISAASVSALVQLLPYHWSQQDKLREVRTEVKVMEGRVQKLRSEFSHNFDPGETKSIMQQKSYRFDANQRPIILMNQDQTVTEQSDSAP
ncbi:hypothetical protein FJR11_12190 [Anabaena sp. UHCC 0187]|uniref:slr1601 family putative cell division protein n=1 Tax=Anabaena sp. UHCC 0187 TaxID=2590018 RepID=UPI0014478AB8|nr:hypothetical protein [Anabaena sp. UHCC 0187]MDP5018812.1 hypothetical protein [Dolichospermum sp.]MTJ13335.1 hypothetical protein [Anabaena sp. UHCC 0187]